LTDGVTPGIGRGSAGDRDNMQTYILVAVGGALGSVARYWCSTLAVGAFGESFPWGTLLVNVAGSFIIGAAATLSDPDGHALMAADGRAFVMVGLCGGYTTFSSFSLQTLGLLQDGHWLRAGANVVLSVCLCLLAVWLGHAAINATMPLPAE
jgi:CrcB protein